MRLPNGLMTSAFLVLILSPWVAGEALAMTEGKTAQNQPYVSGGVALGEQESIIKRRPEFSLWVVTAAKKTGSYLADARVKITDAAGRIVLDTKLDGPWLLVKLDSGRYKVDASFGQQIQQKTIALRMDDHRETIFYFDVEAEALPPGVKG